MVEDKRIQRTRNALRNALLELMVERGYEGLTVQHVLDRAGVGRATFYLHYRGKDDLLRKSLDGLREGLARERRQGAPLSFTLAFFRHVDSHRPLYRAVAGRESGVTVDREMRRLLTGLMTEAGLADLAAQYVAGALMAVVIWWLDRNVKLSPAELDAIFRTMTMPALEAFAKLDRQARGCPSPD